MDKKLYQSYAILDSDIKELEAKKDELKAKILAEMLVEKADQVKIEKGMFSLVTRKTFKYTSKVEKEKAKLDELKKLEEESGAAKATVSQSIMFKAAKQDE